ncbi:hypothetical protein FOZ63_014218, partial [Perkinsus olseni]
TKACESQASTTRSTAAMDPLTPLICLPLQVLAAAIKPPAESSSYFAVEMQEWPAPVSRSPSKRQDVGVEEEDELGDLLYSEAVQPRGVVESWHVEVGAKYVQTLGTFDKLYQREHHSLRVDDVDRSEDNDAADSRELVVGIPGPYGSVDCNVGSSAYHLRIEQQWSRPDRPRQ